MIDKVIIQFTKEIVNNKPESYTTLTEDQFYYIIENINTISGLYKFLKILNNYENGVYQSLPETVIKEGV